MTAIETKFIKAGIAICSQCVTHGYPDTAIAVINGMLAVSDVLAHRRLLAQARDEFECGQPEKGETLLGMISL
jgi:hypothetical protein